MTPLPVNVYVGSFAAHTTQFYSGLYMLQEQGKVKVALKKAAPVRGSQLEIEVDQTPVFIDLNDSSSIVTDALKKSTFYFKRMLLKVDEMQEVKLKPYGLNYPVYYKNDHSFQRSFFAHSNKMIVNNIIRSSSVLSRLLSINLGMHNAQVHHFEQSPTDDANPMVMFSARLWYPYKPKDKAKQEQRAMINQQRVAIVNKARQQLRQQFTGGIDIDKYAQQTAPEALITNKQFAHKSSYLKLLRQCSIGIATAGLEDSIGFKLAEYVSMSKAIVTTPLDHYALPGAFSNGENYLQFSHSADDCIARCEQLLSNHHLRKRMMQNNYEYYQQYLRPDKLVWNILQQVVNG